MQTIEPCRDPEQVRRYIDAHWRKDHILARDERMFAFQYQTPWVERAIFPSGISVMCGYDSGSLVGFIGAIVAPYPAPRSMWLALWHVLPELKGAGLGGHLLQSMQERALGDDGRGWIGTFGAGTEALPVYLKRGYACRASRRWIYDSKLYIAAQPLPRPKSMNVSESVPDAEWLRHRYERHPVFSYEQSPGGVFRTERNVWGTVTHALLLRGDFRHDVAAVFERERVAAEKRGDAYLMDAWSVDSPGSGWTLAPAELPSVFRPPAARGNLTYASGRPFLPADNHKGDCDQDRPN